MLLETGGPVQFQLRAVEGVQLADRASHAERLILDGQQRLTSLTQVLKLSTPVQTRDEKGRDIKRVYYIDIEKALGENGDLDEAIFGVDEDRTQRTNFGRDIVRDVRTPEKEYEQFLFPCSQILKSDDWEMGLHHSCPEKFPRYMEFRERILNAFRNYDVPVIDLKIETGKEAVCLVFEKVNTGGVALSVLDLVTASYAADGFNLQDDWYGTRAVAGRRKGFAAHPLLRDVEPTEFLQGFSLLRSYEARNRDLAAGKTGKQVTAVSARREHVLALPLADFKTSADPLSNGFVEADKFLRREGFDSPSYLPYRSQLIPLAAVMVHLRERWLESGIYERLARWFWCGALGELYGGAVETRIGLDMPQLLAWALDGSAPEPTTVSAAGFQPSRLDTLRTRTSAAYRAIYVLLQRNGASDFFWKTRMADLDRHQYYKSEPYAKADDRTQHECRKRAPGVLPSRARR